MKYIKEDKTIKILNTEDFDIIQILECGQIFRFEVKEDVAIVFSKDKKAEVYTKNNEVIIKSDDIDYFENFFDLKTDYSHIKEQLRKDNFLCSAVDYGYGIRILNNDAYEMIISFIISANNNIKRIKKSIEFLCVNFGTDKGGYFAFPTLNQLKKVTIQEYRNAGLGYRAEQMFETVQILTEEDVEALKTKEKEEQLKFLISLKGVGEKVANCIMLFGLGVKDVFPVDTWINKVYNKLTNTNETNRAKITKELTQRYGVLSGYAQQYFFYYFRENSIK